MTAVVRGKSKCADCAVQITVDQQHTDLALEYNACRSGQTRVRERVRRPLLVDGRNTYSADPCRQLRLASKGIRK